MGTPEKILDNSFLRIFWFLWQLTSKKHKESKVNNPEKGNTINVSTFLSGKSQVSTSKWHDIEVAKSLKFAGVTRVEVILLHCVKTRDVFSIKCI